MEQPTTAAAPQHVRAHAHYPASPRALSTARDVAASAVGALDRPWSSRTRRFRLGCRRQAHDFNGALLHRDLKLDNCICFDSGVEGECDVKLVCFCVCVRVCFVWFR